MEAQMMATLERVATRTIFVHPNSDPANLWPTHRLLADLGHEVTSTSTLEEALRLMRDDPTDLLILEEPPKSEASFREEELKQIRSLPASLQPREVAIFSDRPGAADRVRPTGVPRVHILVKPLHMHGLLQIVRQLSGRLGTSVN
jgi:DNA-binding response OmpR family regulator